MALSKKNTDALIASFQGGAKGARLLTGAFPQQLGIMKGNVGNCKKRLAACQEDPKVDTAVAAPAAGAPAAGGAEVVELGESSDPVADIGPDVSLRETKLKPCYGATDCTKGPTTTAVEDDEKKSGESNEFLDAVKRLPQGTSPKTTAYQDYAKSQDVFPFSWLHGKPGMKLAKDRMPASHIRSLVMDTANLINKGKTMDAKDDAEGLAKVKDASEKSLSAESDAHEAKRELAAFHAPKSTAVLMAEMSSLTSVLNQCMEDVTKVCKDGKAFEVAEAGSTKEEVLDKHPNPRDSPEHNPSEGSLSPKVMTKGGDGGSKAISPGQDATDSPQ